MESSDVSTQDHQEKNADFLQSMKEDADIDDNGVAETIQDSVKTSSPSTDEAKGTSIPYTSRKPKWWHRLGPGKPTKGQKKAIQVMQATHQLPRLAYNTMYDWTDVFGRESFGESTSSYPWLEIGCGTGENLLALAERCPTQTLIGAEMHASGIGNCFQRMYQATQRHRLFCGYLLYSEDLEKELQRASSTTEKEEANAERDNQHTNYNDESLYSSHTVSEPYPNVRIFPGNGVKVLQASPDASLDAVLITFPDPFPKDASYRLLQLDVLDEIARVLRPGIGRLVVATDHDGHAAWAAKQVEDHQKHRLNYKKWNKLSLISTDLRAYYLPAISKYEAKGWREGRTTKVIVYESATHDARENARQT